MEELGHCPWAGKSSVDNVAVVLQFWRVLGGIRTDKGALHSQASNQGERQMLLRFVKQKRTRGDTGKIFE